MRTNNTKCNRYDRIKINLNNRLRIPNYKQNLQTLNYKKLSSEKINQMSKNVKNGYME